MPLYPNDPRIYLSPKGRGESVPMEFESSFESDAPVSEALGGLKERNKAFMQLENPLLSLISQENGLPDAGRDTDYQVWDDLTEDEKLDENFIDAVLYAENHEELEATRSQIDAEQRRRNKVAEGGVMESLLFSTTDPFNYLLPGGAAIASYKTGGSILKGAAVTAMASTADATAVEILNHQTQLIRTYGESAANIGMSAFFGGALGLGVGVVKGKLKGAKMEELKSSFDPEGVIAKGGNSTLAPDSHHIGAAEAVNDARVRGEFVRKFAKQIRWSTSLRGLTSDSPATRAAVSDLVENPIAMDKPTGIAVQSVIKTKTDGRFIEMLLEMQPVYKAYKKNGGLLKEREFNVEVSKAVRNGSDDPHIQQAADIVDRVALHPTRDDAIDVGLFDKTPEVKTAKNYLHRMWSRDKLIADYPDAVATFKQWLGKTQLEKASQAKAKKAEIDAELQGKLDEDLQARELLDDAELHRLAQQIADRIIGTPDGRLPYDYQIGADSKGRQAGNNLSGPFQKRAFLIPDEMVEDWLENDIELVVGRYLHQVIPDIELTRRFGDVEMVDQIDAIRSWWSEKTDKAATPKERKSLTKKRDADIRDVKSMRDRIRGVHNIPEDQNNLWLRMFRTARDLNYMRLLGGVTASSWPDFGRVLGAEGIMRVFGDGLRPLVRNMAAFRGSAREGKLMGIGTQALSGHSRAEILADLTDYTAGGTWIERGTRKGAQLFSKLNLINYWTDAMKQLHFVTAQTRIIRDLKKGIYDPRLSDMGISKDDALGMVAEFNRHGKTIDGVETSGHKFWENRELARIWSSALRKESDRVILMPGEERPLFMSTEVGKTMMQFKTFQFSAVDRILIGVMQNRDRYRMTGIISQVMMGMMTYYFKQWDADRPISTDPKVVLLEGIDRSGMLGIFMEMNNTLEKITGNRAGLRPGVGINTPASRYASRSVVDSAVGPTFGLVGDMVKIMSAFTGERDWTESDTRTLRRLAVGQNLSVFRQLIDQMEDAAHGN